MSRLSLPFISLCSLLALPAQANGPADPSPLRVYALDCGHARLDDGAPASDTGEYDGEAIELADPCFLIHHPRGWLLWDAGLAPDVASGPGFDAQAGPPLPEQLAALGLKVDDIGWLAFSHLHFDHVGNAKLLQHATWILNREELAWAEHEPAHVSMQPALFAAYHHAKTQFIDGDYDVFGDGRVRILKAPGHTPGSAVLWVDLHARGPIMLSGDLFLFRHSRDQTLVPTVNADRAQTLASMARIERIARRTHARVIVQHDPADYASLPRAPAFLD